ncbi:MAG: hypothetical protein HY223_08750 [Thaumarchaeota archaeon]|nr:hypothetical protein [Nitrososphaerota archaeon]
MSNCSVSQAFLYILHTYAIRADFYTCTMLAPAYGKTYAKALESRIEGDNK